MPGKKKGKGKKGGKSGKKGGGGAPKGGHSDPFAPKDELPPPPRTGESVSLKRLSSLLCLFMMMVFPCSTNSVTVAAKCINPSSN